MCNELAMLKIPDDISETLFNELDRVFNIFGARENSSTDGELTDQNIWFLILTPWSFTLSFRMNKETKFQ